MAGRLPRVRHEREAEAGVVIASGLYLSTGALVLIALVVLVILLLRR